MEIFIQLIKIGVFITIPIFFILFFKNKLLSRYSAKFNYFLSIVILLRMVFFNKVTIEIDNYKKYEFLNKISGKSIFENINLEALKPILFIIMVIWTIGFVFSLIKMFYHNYKIFTYISSYGEDVEDEEILKIFNEKKKDLKINKNIGLMTLENINSAMIENFKGTKIILPDEIYTKKELELIFTHELMHFKTKDNYIKLITNIITCIYWFNPLVKYFKIYIRDLCELSTDEKVIKNFSKEEIKEYATLLVNVREKQQNISNDALTSSFFSIGKKGRLMLRVEELFNKGSKKECYIILAIAICLCLISVVEVCGKDITDYNYIITQDTERGHFLVNENNETYGTYIEGESTEIPDLILIVGDNGKEGYARKEDLYLKQPQTPEEAIEYEKNKKNRIIPVYKSDGVTVIDQIKIVEGK